MAMTVLFGVFLVLLLAGVPIGIALGVAGLATLTCFDLGAQMAGVNFVSGIASFPLLAVPFFVLAGVILEKAALAARIARLCELLVGRSVGGLALVAVITCMFWGAISGSGPATTAAVGLILFAPMARHGYDRNFAAATIANAGDLSIIIPPSIAFIIYGSITGTSVSALFLAGVIPGMVCGLGIMLVAWFISWKRGYHGLDRRGSVREIVLALRDAFWALLAPVIILGGIYTGICTPTEAAVIAVFYSLVVGMAVYRSVRIRDLIPILVDTSATTAVIMLIVAFAGIFSWAATTTGFIDSVADALIRISPNALTLILLINVLLLLLGMFLDAISISYLLMPILVPVLARFHIDPVWYGVIFVTALAIGQTTPPVGVNLITVANLAETDMDSVSREMIPYVAINVVCLLLLSLLPVLSLWLPKISGLY